MPRNWNVSVFGDIWLSSSIALEEMDTKISASSLLCFGDGTRVCRQVRELDTVSGWAQESAFPPSPDMASRQRTAPVRHRCQLSFKS